MKKDFLTKAYLASGCKASDTAFVHSSSLGVSLKKKASLLRSSSWKLWGRTKSKKFLRVWFLLYPELLWYSLLLQTLFNSKAVKWNVGRISGLSAESVGGHVLLLRTGSMAAYICQRFEQYVSVCVMGLNRELHGYSPAGWMWLTLRSICLEGWECSSAKDGGFPLVPVHSRYTCQGKSWNRMRRDEEWAQKGVKQS